MRAVLQRVLRARVEVQGEVVGQIDAGLCVFVGVGQGDDERRAEVLADKVITLRIFEDDAGKMNRSLIDVAGGLLAVSQFTLLADTSRGRRPSFTAALEPVRAAELFEHFCHACRGGGITVATGRFRTEMQVTLVNDGPVTIWLDV